MRLRPVAAVFGSSLTAFCGIAWRTLLFLDAQLVQTAVVAVWEARPS